ERTQAGPKEDRLRLTRATRHNLSPIFALHPGGAWQHLEPILGADPWGEVTDGDGTTHRVWRVADPSVHDAIAAQLEPAELLIADGHHRYETALAYQREVGAGGPADFVLMALVSLEDPGLTVFATHRLLESLDSKQQEGIDRKSTRLNSSHRTNSYAAFCLKKKKQYASADALALAERYGIKVWVWTVDDRRLMERFIKDRCVEGLITNRPDVALKLRTARA